MASEGMGRRRFLELSGATLIAASAADLVGCATSKAAVSAGPSPGVGYFGRFGVTEPLLAEVLAAAMSRGADHADVFYQHRVSSSLGLQDGAVNRSSASVSLGVGVRAVKGDQQGYGYTEDLSLPAILECARTAAAIADGPARTEPVRFHVRSGLPERYPVKVRWEDVRPEQTMPILSRLEAQVLASDSRVKKVNISFGDEYGAILIADSSGRIVEDVQPMTRLYLQCTAEQNGKRESGGYNVAARAGLEYYDEDRLARLVREAVGRTTTLFEAVPAPAGEMPVVLAAGSSGILLHEAIGHGMEADFNRKNVSIFSDKIGKPVAKPFVNIVDDATVQSARGAINVDDEGNDAGRTSLVENGILTTYLHDSVSARHYGVKPTGNGRRESYQFAPIPRMRATYMLPGPHAKEEIVASVKKGIFCSNFTNGQVNIGAGDFTFYVKNGWLIEDGKLTRPVKDVNVIGNGPKVLERIDMVANDLVIDEGGWTCGKDGQGVPVSQGIPTVRVSSITVGGQRKA